LYSTSIEQFALGAVWALAVATFPCPVGGRLTIVTVSGGAGLGVGLEVRGGGVGAGGGVRVGLLGATVAVGRDAVGLVVVGGGEGVGVGEAADELGGAATGGPVLAGGDSDPDPTAEAASPQPAPRVTRPTNTAAIAAVRFDSRKGRISPVPK
jgi:hypothetical protein